MVIELTDGLARYKQEQREMLMACLNNLFLGYYEGNLVITASPALCRFIEAHHLVEGVRQQKALAYLINSNGNIPNVLWIFKVVLDNPDVTNHELPIDFFNTTESIQPTSMLCENLDDIKFYIKQARCFHPYSPMAVNRRHGGGGTTYDVFNILKNRNLFCLVIVDSDVKYPGCGLGETANRFDKNYKAKQTNVEVKILPVHEAENLVPVSFMMSHSKPSGTIFLKKLEKRGVLRHLVFYDIKNGITKEKTEEKTQYKKYAKDIYEGVYPHNRNGFDAYYAHKNMSDNLLPKINANLLTDYINNNAESYQTDELETYRKEIADLVYTFLCCRGSDPIL